MKRIILIILVVVLLVPGYSQTKTFSKYGDAISDFLLKVASGMYPGIKVVNKYGRSTDVDAHDTDIWDGAVAGDAGDTWIAPTEERIHNIVSGSANDTCGVSVLTLTGLPLDTETVTIGIKVYTFQTTLTDVDGNVLIGATASDSLDNLIAGIMLTAGAGTTYATSMTANAVSIEAVAGAGDTMNLYDLTSANIASTQALTNGTWDASTVVPGTGARSIMIYGLNDWDTKESNETIILKGVVNVATLNKYVIIHRMRVLNAGASGPNVGIISATAVTDGTVTAQVSAMAGQTQMAIYGIPSNQYAYMSYYYMSAIKTSTSLSVENTLLINYIPKTELIGGWNTKHTVGVATEGNNYIDHIFKSYFQIPGPAIIKMRGNSSASNTDVSAGFSLILVDN